jgi:hypothetical protein
VRRLIAGALTPRHIAAMEQRLIERVDSLLDVMSAREPRRRDRPDRRLRERDPGRDHRQPARGAGRGARAAARLVAGDPRRPRADAERRAARARQPCRARVPALPRGPGRAPPRRARRSRGRRPDPLIAGEGGETLERGRALHNCIFLLNAGHETTTNLIGNGLACLLDWPDEKARLLAEPALVRTAVEEFLRFESSNQLGNRITTCATEIDGVALAPRTSVTIGIGAANRDPSRSRPRSARHRATPEPARRLRLGHSPVRRHGLAAPRRAGRSFGTAPWRAFPPLPGSPAPPRCGQRVALLAIRAMRSPGRGSSDPPSRTTAAPLSSRAIAGVAANG